MNLHPTDASSGTQLVIFRTSKSNKQTLSRLVVFNVEDICIFHCVGLELPFLDNKTNISSIPADVYRGRRWKSPKFGTCLKILDVPKRQHILVHVGNYYTDTSGCILVGRGFRDLNYDGLKDVYDSLRTLRKLVMAMSDSFEVVIFDVPEASKSSSM